MGSLSAVEAWGFYLMDPEFDDEPELRNKLGTIWICSLLDTLEAGGRFLPAVAKEAEPKGFQSLVFNARQLQNLCVLMAEVMDLFTREEQIYLVDSRNRWVHSYLANPHGDVVVVKYAAGGKIKTERLANADYHTIVRSFYEDGKNPDAVLAPMVARALDQKLRYWVAIGTLQKKKEAIYAALLEGKIFEIKV